MMQTLRAVSVIRDLICCMPNQRFDLLHAIMPGGILCCFAASSAALLIRYCCFTSK
jgi:hypothetical protein